MSERAFFYNVRTNQVEELERKSQAKDLMGPYPSREAAAAALETARARTEAWDREDAGEDAGED
ncbi:hypothetical protein CLV92_106193 [Kineococcus xinjiangensis]|uniref:SPOR domain-containing protein n=1 Tax=Kineococcus xinjiangensis TaxID=512762 RepID=A0A2S6IM99_9ACTN|nr:hypothetical protein [Kineococcus xinjiangensis]PPK95372.1 hypothetical protein CLV92_106193 [Kineococcus xinjiangensis]